MPSFTGATLTTLKLTGTAALGLLTGAHLTFSLSTLEHLITPSSLSTATKLHEKRITIPLAIYSTSALVFTYLFSPPRGRHPYLLMAAIMPIVGFGVDMGILKRQEPKARASPRKAKLPPSMAASTGEDGFYEVTRSVILDNNKPSPTPGDRTPTSSQGVEEESTMGFSGIDGTVDEQAETYKFANLANAAVTGFGFLIGLVGNWGEGYYYYS